MIVAAGLSPAWQHILSLDALRPGEVNRAREYRWCASGKAINVGIALNNLGADSLTLTLAGGRNGDALRADLEGLGVPHRLVPTQAPTRVCTTLLEASSARTTELVENAPPVTPDELEQFKAAYREAAANAEWAVLSGSLPQGTPRGFYNTLLDHGPANVVLDFRGPELLAALRHRPLVVKPNRQELAATFQVPPDDTAALEDCISELISRHAGWVLVTDGPRPVRLASQEERYVLTPPAVEGVVNPIGSGDCLAGALAFALSEGRPMPDAARFALGAALDNLTQLMPARLDRQRVESWAGQVRVEAC